MILSNDISVKSDKRNKSDNNNINDKYDKNEKSVPMWHSSRLYMKPKLKNHGRNRVEIGSKWSKWSK